MKFGIGISNCREGLDYPAGFSKPSETVKPSQSAERLGLDSIWADDHLTPRQAVLKGDPQPPNFYESLCYIGWDNWQGGSEAAPLVHMRRIWRVTIGPAFAQR